MQWLPRSQCGRARCLVMDSHGDEQCGTGVVIMLVQRAVPHFDCDCQAKAYLMVHYFYFAAADVFAKAHAYPGTASPTAPPSARTLWTACCPGAVPLAGPPWEIVGKIAVPAFHPVSSTSS